MGGLPNDIVEVLGDASVNKSIGSHWKNKGVNALGEKEKLSRVLAYGCTG